MCAYFSKVQDETSEAMKQAAKAALNGNKLHYENMKAIDRAHAAKMECFVQEAACLVIPELWLRKIFLKVIFLNTKLPEKQYKILKQKNVIDSTDLFQRNIFNRYLDWLSERFKNGAYKIINKLCFVELLSYCYIVKKYIENSDNDY